MTLLLSVLLTASAANLAPIEPSWPSASASCAASADRRAASVDQLGAGDEARIAQSVTAAFGHYRAAIDLDPCNGFAWLQLSELLQARGDLGLARQASARAVKHQPRSGRAWVVHGRLALADGDALGALDAFQEALVVAPRQPGAEAGLRKALATLRR